MCLGMSCHLKASNIPHETADSISTPPSHTIHTLALMSDAQLFQLIEKEGINVECIPEGVSAGRPGRINKEAIREENTTKSIFKYLFNFLGSQNSQTVAGLIWKGKTLQRSPQNCSTGFGVNRVGLLDLFTLKTHTLGRNKYVADQGRFIDASEENFVNSLIANPNDVNMVELNYSEPGRDPAGAGKAFGVRDIMVPIMGKYGIIYIGRAYTGKWLSETQFQSSGLVAWFFLDFSPEAVREQKWFKLPF
jgi:hypothetical protein